MKYTIFSFLIGLGIAIVVVGFAPAAFAQTTAPVTADMKINGSDGPVVEITRGDRVTIVWTSSNARWCSVRPTVSAFRTSGSYSFVTSARTPDERTYTLACHGRNGDAATDSITVRAISPPAPPLPGNGNGTGSVSVSFAATPTVIQPGQSAVLSWSSQNATQCMSSGSWSGARPLSGSLTVTQQQTSTYTLTCSDGAQSVTRSVTVTAQSNSTPPPPPPASSNGQRVTLEVRNMTLDQESFSQNVQAQSLDNLEFRITVRAESVSLSQPRIRVALPDEIFFLPTSAVAGGVTVSDDIVENGIVIGDIAAGGEAAVTFRGVVYYGVGDGAVHPEARLTAGAIDETSSVTAQITDRGQVRGAATIVTGPRNTMLWMTGIAFMFSLILYLVFYRFRIHKNSSLHNAHARVRLAAATARLRRRERYPDTF